MTRDAPRTFRSRRLVRLSTQTRARMERAGAAGPKRGPVIACPRDVFAEWGGSKKFKPGGKILGGHRSRAPRTGCQPTRKGCCGTVGGRRGGSWCTPAENPCTCGKLWCTKKKFLLGHGKPEIHKSAKVQKSNPLYWVVRWSAKRKSRVGWRHPGQKVVAAQEGWRDA